MNVNLTKYVLSLDGTLLDAIEAIKNNRSRCVMLMSGDRVAGVLSEGDIMSALLQNADIHAPIGEYVRHNFKFLSERDLGKALKLMRDFGLTLVPVVDHELHLLDVITLNDLLLHLTLDTSIE
jgi:CBS domain-containing protein